MDSVEARPGRRHSLQTVWPRLVTLYFPRLAGPAAYVVSSSTPAVLVGARTYQHPFRLLFLGSGAPGLFGRGIAGYWNCADPKQNERDITSEAGKWGMRCAMSGTEDRPPASHRKRKRPQGRPTDQRWRPGEEQRYPSSAAHLMLETKSYLRFLPRKIGRAHV